MIDISTSIWIVLLITVGMFLASCVWRLSHVRNKPNVGLVHESEVISESTEAHDRNSHQN
jgi:hypothetical protein